MRRLVLALFICSALTSAAFAEKPVAPAAGQTIEEFEKANTAEITATPGNKMGYAVQKCPLKPQPFAGAGELYFGFGPRADHGDETIVDLIGVRDGRVTEWKQFVLPDFQGWLTHYVWECKAKSFQVLHDSKVEQRFRWTGSSFEKITTAAKRR